MDFPRRQVRAPNGAIYSLTIKAQQVLLQLVMHHGKVVSRDELMERVWPDTMPTNDVITQAVTQLRKAFSDDASSPRYVETIAKAGYRLVAPIEWLKEPTHGVEATGVKPDIPSNGATPEQRQSLRSGIPAIVALSMGAILLATIAWRFSSHVTGAMDPPQGTISPQPGAMPAMQVLNLTARPGMERSPALSPDGAMLAYSETTIVAGGPRQAIMLQATDLVQPRQLTHPEPDEDDNLPSWSPGGRRLAFQRLGRDGTCRMMWISVSGGAEHNIGSCSAPSLAWYDWMPDGKGLLIGGEPRPGRSNRPLLVLDIETGQRRDLRYPIGHADIDLEPHYSPDGRWIGFRRNFSLTDLWMMPAEGGIPVRLTRLEADIRGWDWTPDSRAMVLSLIDSKSKAPVLHHLDLTTGRVQSLAVKDATRPDIAARAAVMAFEIDDAKSSVHKYSAHSSSSSPMAAVQPVLTSSGHDVLPSISPDGTRLAHISNRSGEVRLWLSELAHPELLRPVPGLLPITRHPPVWSADNKHLLLIGESSGRPQLYEVDVDSDRVIQQPVPDGIPVHAAYSNGTRKVIVVDQGSGRPELRLYETVSTPWRLLGKIAGANLARVDSADEKIYFTRVGRAGLWVADKDLQGHLQILEDMPSLQRYRHWQVYQGNWYYLDTSERCRLLWTQVDLNRPRVSKTVECLSHDRLDPGIPSISEKADWVYLASYERADIDIARVELQNVQDRVEPSERVEMKKK